MERKGKELKMKFKRMISVLLCMLLCVGLSPGMVYATDNSALMVDGVNALETSSGEGWQYDSTSNTLTLNNYTGGGIVAKHMGLKIVLAEGSENTISSEEAYGISCLQEYDLQIVGTNNSTLEIAAKEHVVYSLGNVIFEGLNMTAKNTSNQSSTGAIGCVYTKKNLIISDSALNITTPGSPSAQIGLSCSGATTIQSSNITINAGMHGIVSIYGMEIVGTTLNISAGVAALHSNQSGISLAECTGDLTAQTAAIYAENNSGKSKTELTNCQINLTAPYGVMTYSDIVVDGGTIDFDCTELGIFAYSKAYDAVAQFKGVVKTICTAQTPQLMEVTGTYVADDTVNVTGVILENTGDNATTRILLVGDMVLSVDKEYRRNILIPAGANVLVPTNVTFNFSSALSVTIEGKLTNKGSLTLNGTRTNNKGSIYNYGELNLADNKNIVNTGKIYSSCVNSFDLTPYAENGIILHSNMMHTAAVTATHMTEGNKEYWYCNDCKKYFSDEAGVNEITLESTVIPKLTEHTADNAGWHSDETNHWNTCECGEVIDKEAHKFGDWTVTKEPTKTEAGSRTKSCTVCGYEVTESIPATGTTEPSEPPTPPIVITYYDITAEQPEHGTITLERDRIYRYGDVDVTLTPDEGYEVKDLLINGVSVGAVSNYTIEDVTEDIHVTAVFGETEAAKNARIAKGVQNTKIKASFVMKEIGRGWIKIRWTKEKGYAVDYYEVFRSAKSKTGFGKEAYFTKNGGKLSSWYKNTKQIKKGTRYYYKVRGVREIDGKLYYTKWSNVVMRTGR